MDISNDSLRERIRAIDPAPAERAPALDPHALEAVMQEITTPDPTADLSRAAAGRRRWWLAAPLAGAAAAALWAGSSLMGGGMPAPTQAARPAPSVTMSIGAPAGGGASAICVPLDVDNLKGAEFAFDAVVVSVEPGPTAEALTTVTFAPTKWWRGEPADRVVLSNLGTDVALVGIPNFVVGQRYLVSGAGSEVGACGFSGEYSASLLTMYQQAFGS